MYGLGTLDHRLNDGSIRMAESIDRELQTLKSDFATLNQAVADLARDVKALLAATVSAGEDKTRANVQESLHGLKEKMGQVQDQGRKYVESTEQRIGEQPSPRPSAASSREISRRVKCSCSVCCSSSSIYRPPRPAQNKLKTRRWTLFSPHRPGAMPSWPKLWS